MRLRHLDLFSGIGGFALAVKWLGHETVGFCEIDPWCRRVLDKHWPEVPKHDDIKTLNGTDFGAIDIITGGFPCQPFSVAGKQRGRDDDRHLWPEMLRVISEARPRYILGKNVAGIVKMELDTIWSDLEALGYSVGAVVVPAGAVNALHRRDRLWIMAYANESDTPDGGQRAIATCEGEGRRNDRGGSYRDAGQVPVRGAGSDPSGSVANTRVEGLEGTWLEGRPVFGSSGEAVAYADQQGLEGHGQLHPASGEAQVAAFGGGGSVPDAERERQSGSGAREHASHPTSGGEGQADHALNDDPTREGRTTPQPLGTGPDGLSPELVRRSWADGSWEAGLPRVVPSEEQRKQKLMGAGNAIVPQVAYEILRVMIGEAGE